jgi:hypothetical protein
MVLVINFKKQPDFGLFLLILRSSRAYNYTTVLTLVNRKALSNKRGLR